MGKEKKQVIKMVSYQNQPKSLNNGASVKGSGLVLYIVAWLAMWFFKIASLK